MYVAIKKWVTNVIDYVGNEITMLDEDYIIGIRNILIGVLK